MKNSTGLVNYVAATGSLKAALAGGEIRIWSGSPPADADAAATGTLLCTIKNAGAGINFDTAAVGGTLPKAPAETWSGTNVATGVAGYFRHVLAADANDLSTTAIRIQGTVGTGGADLNISSTSLTSGAPCPIDGYNVTIPRA